MDKLEMERTSEEPPKKVSKLRQLTIFNAFKKNCPTSTLPLTEISQSSASVATPVTTLSGFTSNCDAAVTDSSLLTEQCQTSNSVLVDALRKSSIPSNSESKPAQAATATCSNMVEEFDDNVLSSKRPYQPQCIEGLPVQLLSNKKLVFQPSWFHKFPWLHHLVSGGQHSIVCYICAKAEKLKLLGLATKCDDAFTTRGYKNWKNAVERFKVHEKSTVHLHSASQILQLKAPAVDIQMSRQKEVDQLHSRAALIKLFTSLQYILKQGIAVRGHNPDEGNYMQLLQLRSSDSTELKKYLSKITKFTSPESQNEMMQMLSHSVLRTLVKCIKDQSKQYSIIVDGTEDCSGLQQESVCIRFVDDDIEPNEVFLGLYQPSDTSGSTIASLIEDVLLRLDLPIADLRGQTFDGAANMTGAYNGCGVLLSLKQPLALQFHCGAHCINLVAQTASTSSEVVSNGLAIAHELGTLVRRSGKLKSILSSAVNDITGNFSVIKPLCPTRWLCRGVTLQRILDQYEGIMKGLDDMANCTSSETSIKSRGILHRLQQGETLLGLQVAMMVFQLIEELNVSLQARTASVSGMLEAFGVVRNELSNWRSDEKFAAIFGNVEEMIEKLDLEPLIRPRQRRVPARFCGSGEQSYAQSALEYYRIEYFAFLDTTIAQLNNRFDTTKQGIARYLEFEEILHSGKLEKYDAVIKQYPEIDSAKLAIQLAMFKSTYSYKTMQDCKQLIQKMSLEVRGLFSEVERLIRLMLLCPVSSCEAERSFSALRRLKTWLRSTMTQERLNSVAVCHVNTNVLDAIDIPDIAAQFVTRSAIRQSLFGSGPFL